MPAPRKSTRQRKRPTAGSPEPVATLAPDEPDTRWWVLVASSIPELGAGRYGVWDDKPKVEWEEGEGTLVAAIKGKVGEPELHVNMTDTLTFSIGQIAHFESTPKGTQQPPSPEHNGQ
jgi:hypothetical protein